MKETHRVLEFPFVYRLTQGWGFAEQKWRPLLRHNDMTSVRRALDVGCGPGTNAIHFSGCDYLGLDINPRYIAYARRRYRGTFQTADVTRYRLPADEQPFDFVLANSFFHHTNDEDTRRILHHLATLVSKDGHIHVLDLVRPGDRSLGELFARIDRGEHARPFSAWQDLMTADFEPVVFEPFGVGVWGRTLWSMFYFKGKARR